MSARVAAIQMCSGLDVDANLDQAGRLLEAAAAGGAVLAVLPENFAFMGQREADRVAIAEAPGAGPVQSWLSERSSALGLWIVGGTVPVGEPGENRPRAACIVYDAQGQVAARYDKIHLFDVALPDGGQSYRESAGTTPGETLVVADTPAGRLGLAVCYDLRFPEMFRAMAAASLDVISLPAAFTVPTGEAHWDILVRARAVENLCGVVAAAQWGDHEGGRRTWGHSMVVNHWGEVLACQAEGIGVAIAELDPDAQAQARARFPALAHRRLTGTQDTLLDGG